MEEKLEFSVLMTTYHREKPEFLEAALDSITTKQTLLPNQVVLVLDGPIGEGLEQVVSKFSKSYPTIFEVVRLPENIGRGLASKNGLEYCKFAFIARMDSDDISVPDRFERQILEFKKRPDVDVISGYNGEFVTNPEDIVRVKQVPETNEEIIKAFRMRNPINNTCVMFKKGSVDKIGGYRGMKLFEDFDLYTRLLIDGANFYNIPSVLVNFRFNDNVVTRRSDSNVFSDFRDCQKQLLKANKTNLFYYVASCSLCLCFTFMPKNAKKLAYGKLLRKKI